MALPPVFIEFLGSYTGLKVAANGVKRELASVDAEGATSLKSLGSVSSAVLKGLGIAAIGVAYESTKLAASFQQSMTRISTQAGLPKSALAGLSADVLSLAGQVGFSPDSLAEALYHVESSFSSVGITGAKAMSLVKIAAQGAAVGGADLVDVQNALDAAVASGIPGVQNFGQAMGALNAIVGSGDMKMQDLADALGTQGLLAVLKGYGLSLADVGAGLATFGDNNLRGAEAATSLRMAVQALQTPAKSSGEVLKKMGMNTDTLANAMKNGGLLPALEMLKTRMDAAGLGGKNMSQTLTALVGKKAGGGLNILISQLDRVKSKYPEISKSAKGFGDAVTQQNATLSQHLADAKASLDAIGVTIGNKLLPPITTALGELSKGLSWLSGHTSVFWALSSGLGALSAAMVIAKIATIEWSATLWASPITWIAAAIIALGAGIYYAYTHFATFRNIVNAAGRVLKDIFGAAVDFIRAHLPEIEAVLKRVGGYLMTAWNAAWKFAGGIVRWFINNPIKWVKQELGVFQKFWKQHGQDITNTAKAVWGVIAALVKFYVKFFVDYVKYGLVVLKALWEIGWSFVRDYVKLIWDAVSKAISTAIKVILDIFGAFLDLIHGRWSKLWGDAMKILKDFFSGIYGIISKFSSDALKLLEDAGKNIIKGLVNGIKGGLHMITDTMKSAGNLVTSSFHAIMGIFSPSRVMYKSGGYVVAGLVNALEDGKARLAASAGRMGLAISSGFSVSRDVNLRGLITPVPPSLGTMGGPSGGVVQNVVQLEVRGHVMTEHDLRDLIQQELLRLDGRNGGQYLTARI